MYEINSRWTVDGSSRRNYRPLCQPLLSPNAESDVVKRNVILRAIRNIKPGDEITYDYGPNISRSFLSPSDANASNARSSGASSGSSAARSARPRSARVASADDPSGTMSAARAIHLSGSHAAPAATLLAEADMVSKLITRPRCGSPRWRRPVRAGRNRALAGRLGVPRGNGGLGLAIGLWLARRDPALLAERLTAGFQAAQKTWDKVFMARCSCCGRAGSC
jgi:hypothetical protein